MNLLIGSLMKKPRWKEINKTDMFSVPTGTAPDTGINGTCSLITQIHHRHRKRVPVTMLG